MIAKKFLPRSNSSSASNASKSSTSFLFRKKKSLSDAAPPTPPTPAVPRPISPSERHYFSQTNGGCNAPLTPLSHHYSSNAALLSLFHAAILQDDSLNSLVADGTLTLLDDVAYAAGVRYVEVALFTIPRHGYFETEEYREERRRSVVEARRVVHLLGGLVREERRGDDGGEEKVEEEGEDTRSKRETIHKLAVAAQQSYDQIMMEPEKPNGHSFRSVEAQYSSWKEYVLDGADNLCSLLTVLDCGSLGTVHGKDESVDHPANVHVDAEKTERGNFHYVLRRIPNLVEEEPTLTSSRDESDSIRSQPENLSLGNAASNATNSSAASQNISQKNSGLSMNRSFSNYSQTQPSVEELDIVESCGSIMTEKFVPDVTVDAATSNRTVEVLAAGGGQPMRQDSDGFDRGEIALALSLSRRDCDMATTENTQYQCTKPLHYSNNISAQTKLYAQKFHSLVESEKVHVRFLDTYQGRIPGSTNGCTVIAPLTCIQYFITPESNTHSSHAWNHGLPDEHIHQVIDVHAPTILSNVRSKLNLAPDSFIIPSDVHDHLLQVGLLSPTSFVGVIGGNILDDHHLMQLKNALLLSDDDNERMRLKGRKIASALFSMDTPGDERVFVELIDSLPIPEAWVSPRGRHSSSNSCDSSVCEEREPASDSGYADESANGIGDEWERYERFDFKTADDELPMNAVRIRCTDMEHLDTLLRHYALSKFSLEEQKFIDENPWEDNNSYFDPR
eukprot:CCRYP_007985-RA/>CCRYP_007985-RA protein AED:0.14 eAED:0.32 QI:0/0/0/1/0.5/0.33/3/0/732